MMGPAGTNPPIVKRIELGEQGVLPEVRDAITKGRLPGVLKAAPHSERSWAVQKASHILSDHDVVLDLFRGVWVDRSGQRVQVVQAAER